jgi:Dolichyl-phosphate-mannose-protein mannosyltransferase
MTTTRTSSASPGRTAEPTRSVGVTAVVVAVLTLAGLFLRLPSFNDSLFGDELSTYFIVTGHSLEQVLDWVRSDLEVSPPLFFVLAWATHSLGDPAASIRLVSLIAGVAATPLTYMLGVWTVGRRAALVGAALVALSPFLILYSTQARAYMLVLLLDLLSTLALLRALETRRVGWWIAYAACSCAAVHAHYVAVFVLAGQLGWAFFARPEARRPLIAANVGAAAGFLPWLPGFLDDRNGPNLIGLFEPFTLHGVGRALVRWSIGHPFTRFSALPGAAAELIAAAGLAIGLVGLALARRRSGVRLAPGTALVLVLALSGPALAALYSAFGTSVFNPQNLIASWPGLALSVGLLVTSAGRLSVLATALVLAAATIGTAKMLGADYQRPDYKAAVRYIDRTGKPGDPIVDVPLSGNPITALDAALGYGRASPDPHPVLRIGAPPRETAVRALAQGHSPLAPPPTPRAAATAREAARLARGRTLYLVMVDSGRQLVPSASSSVPVFLRALPKRFRVVKTASFNGYRSSLISDLSVRVVVLRDTGTSLGRE